MVAVALGELGGAIDALLAERSHRIVVVAAPGYSGPLVIDAVGTPADVIVAGRRDAVRPGATAARLRHTSGDTDRAVVVGEAQWSDEQSLAGWVDQPPPRGLVLVHRPGHLTPLMAEATVAARRDSAWLAVAPATTEQLAGNEAERARELIALTAGMHDLLEAIDRDGDLVAEVNTRLSLVDDGARWVAETIAFGGAGAARSLDQSPDELDRAIELLEFEGLLVAGSMPSGVAMAICSHCPMGRRSTIVERLLDDSLPGALPELSALLVSLGDRSRQAGAVHARVAAELAPIEPHHALQAIAAARDAGADETQLSLHEAIALTAIGEPHAALRALAGGHDDPLAHTVRTTAWVELGDLESALGSVGKSTVAEWTAWCAHGVGRVDGAATLEESLVVQAIRAWHAGDVEAASESLRRAVIAGRGDPHLDLAPTLPDVVAALLAVRAGDPAMAQATVAAAVAERIGSRVHQRELQLLAAWIDARRLHLEAASHSLADLAGAAATGLSPRDRLVAAVVRCSIAVRTAEGDDLEAAVRQALTALASVNVHLYDLDLLADVVAAAQRAGVALPDPLDRLQRAADTLAPTSPIQLDLAWARLSAALAGNDDGHVRVASQHLIALAGSRPPEYHQPHIRLASALERGTVDLDEMLSTSAAVAGAGSIHEAARACGLAAVRSGDEAVARRLLRESRQWRAERRQLHAESGTDRSVVKLSDQEQRIAQMVSDGFTHKQIGSALFISPKTVEHHVAHIRTKLGCRTRAEMLAALRRYQAGADPGQEASIPS